MILQSAGVDKIRLAHLFKIHLGVHVEVDPQDGKPSRICTTYVELFVVNVMQI